MKVQNLSVKELILVLAAFLKNKVDKIDISVSEENNTILITRSNFDPEIHDPEEYIL